MTISLASHQRMTAQRAAEAVEFLRDPRRHAIERGYGDVDHGYAYALGEAKAIIQGLLDCLGWCDHGPDRFDCEWSRRDAEVGS